ncbi:MAG: TspO/MBR family protein [Flavobacteriaceae bacterium]|nr:TspO/MBR family protein [Flavobacteriaceae bacterium]
MSKSSILEPVISFLGIDQLSYLKTVIFFLIVNFSVLGIGSLLMGEGAKSEWYLNLNKAPWTPDGWVFGVAWTTIMICFSFYMAYLFQHNFGRGTIWALFLVQVILNASWNLIFFRMHNTQFALVIIAGLTVVVAIFLFNYLRDLRIKSLLIIPYLLWLLVATSLNAYIVFRN